MKKNNTRKAWASILLLGSMLVQTVQFAIPVHAAFIPGGATGPVDPVNGFPKWYQDQNGLALDLMEAADTMGISAPIEPGNAFSQQIGFGGEGFWWSADATITVPGVTKPALLIQGVEAAFAGVSAVNGEQSAFGRVRIRIDVPNPGTYTVTYPFGQKTYNITTVDAAYEINDTVDIGCFAVAGVSSCDPASPLGNPLPQFNFNAVGQSEIGPFLTWDTFNVNPASTDPLLINNATGRRYIGSALVPHTIKGSPTGNNIFRIEGPNIGGPGVNVAETNLFTVTGRLADITAPVITLNGINPDSVVQNGTYTDLGATAVDDIDGDVTAKIQVTGTPVDTTTVGTKTITYSVTDNAGNTATMSRIVNVTAVPVPDTVAPIINIIGNNPATVNVGTPYVDAGATALDNIDGNITANITATGIPVDTATVGIRTVTYQVTDSAGNIATANRTVNVTDIIQGQPILTTLNVASATNTVATGGTLQLTTAALDQFGTAFTPAPTVTFNSADPLIATVDATGSVTAVSPGTTVINAVGNGIITGTISLTVSAPTPQPVPTTVNVVSPAPVINVGGNQGVSVQVLDQNNQPIVPTPVITLTSSNPAIATVDINGVVTAVSPGTVIITAESGGKTSKCALTVSGIDNTSPIIMVDPISTLDNTPELTGIIDDGAAEIRVEVHPKGQPLTIVFEGLATNNGNGTWTLADNAITPPLVEGFYDITAKATDQAGNIGRDTSSDELTIGNPVADVIPPVITLNGNSTINVNVGSAYTDAGASAADNIDGIITPNIVTTGLPINTGAAGTFTVTYNVSDAAGNQAIPVTRTVIVKDQDRAIPVTPVAASSPIYRFWSDKKQSHFFTASSEERDIVIADDPSWTFEGTAFKAFPTQQAGTLPVHRFWSDSKQHHFFTISEVEKNDLIANDPSWKYEGIAYYAYSSPQPGANPVHRFWSDEKKGHFFTESEAEKNEVETNDDSWATEGIAYYVPTN